MILGERFDRRYGYVRDHRFPHDEDIPPHHGRHTEHDVEKFKTQICIHWKEGHCSWGLRCHFAHGPHELGRPVPTNAIQTISPNMFSTAHAPYHPTTVTSAFDPLYNALTHKSSSSSSPSFPKDQSLGYDKYEQLEKDLIYLRRENENLKIDIAKYRKQLANCRCNRR